MLIGPAGRRPKVLKKSADAIGDDEVRPARSLARAQLTLSQPDAAALRNPDEQSESEAEEEGDEPAEEEDEEDENDYGDNYFDGGEDDGGEGGDALGGGGDEGVFAQSCDPLLTTRRRRYVRLRQYLVFFAAANYRNP